MLTPSLVDGADRTRVVLCVVVRVVMYAIVSDTTESPGGDNGDSERVDPSPITPRTTGGRTLVCSLLKS